jgi:integrase
MGELNIEVVIKGQDWDSLTADEAKAVLDTLVGHSRHPIASLALATGRRRGEPLALQWCDIDLDCATLASSGPWKRLGAGCE